VQDANKEVIWRWIAPAPDGSGPFLLSDAARELLAPDAVWHLPPTAIIPGQADPRVVRGRDNIVAIQQRAREIYDVSSIRIDVRNLLADGDWVDAPVPDDLSGRQRQPVCSGVCVLFEILSGVITTIWDYYDTLLVERAVLG